MGDVADFITAVFTPIADIVGGMMLGALVIIQIVALIKNSLMRGG